MFAAHQRQINVMLSGQNLQLQEHGIGQMMMNQVKEVNNGLLRNN
jgi:hypothetical protein